ncbi:MAG: GNAT family N-acetyltransferase [Pseudomonadota bacterium]|mgnify:CR=1 FL=1
MGFDDLDVRQGCVKQADALGRVMWAAIHEGPSLYSTAQRTAWCPHAPQGQQWQERLAGQRIWIAGAPPVGFVTLADGGYVDFAYVLPKAQGQGVFRALMLVLEAVASGPRLWTHASLMAQPAFAALGYDIVHHEEIARGDQTLHRALMEKMRT